MAISVSNSGSGGRGRHRYAGVSAMAEINIIPLVDEIGRASCRERVYVLV